MAIARRGLRTRRIGHAGTLDPFATGLLVLLVGRATRLLPYLEGEPKVYDATIVFGAATDTDDATGTIVAESAPPADTAVDAGIAALTGLLDQVPPAYSAKQVRGVRAHAAARRGEELELEPARVTVHRWELLQRGAARLQARITCSGGTYIRALARDLGRAAGSVAHLAELRRLRSGPFDVAGAVPLDAVRGGEVELRPMLDAVPSMPRHALSTPELGRVLNGNPVPATGDERTVALVDGEGTLVAIADRRGGALHPRMVLGAD